MMRRSLSQLLPGVRDGKAKGPGKSIAWNMKKQLAPGRVHLVFGRQQVTNVLLPPPGVMPFRSYERSTSGLKFLKSARPADQSRAGLQLRLTNAAGCLDRLGRKQSQNQYRCLNLRKPRALECSGGSELMLNHARHERGRIICHRFCGWSRRSSNRVPTEHAALGSMNRQQPNSHVTQNGNHI